MGAEEDITTFETANPPISVVLISQYLKKFWAQTPVKITSEKILGTNTGEDYQQRHYP